MTFLKRWIALLPTKCHTKRHTKRHTGIKKGSCKHRYSCLFSFRRYYPCALILYHIPLHLSSFDKCLTLQVSNKNVWQMSDVLANPYRTKLKTAHFYYLDKIGGKRPITKKMKNNRALRSYLTRTKERRHLYYNVYQSFFQFVYCIKILNFLTFWTPML